MVSFYHISSRQGWKMSERGENLCGKPLHLRLRDATRNGPTKMKMNFQQKMELKLSADFNQMKFSFCVSPFF